MKNLKDRLYEALNENKIDQLEKKLEKVEDKAEKAEKAAEKAEDKAEKAEKEANKSEKTIESEDDFRDYARNKFEEVFGDDLDEDQMKEVIDGLLKDNKELVEKGEWGELVGMLNKSFGK